MKGIHRVYRFKQVMKKVYSTRLWKEETITFNQGVAGSNPAGLTIFYNTNILVFHLLEIKIFK